MDGHGKEIPPLPRVPSENPPETVLEVPLRSNTSGMNGHLFNLRSTAVGNEERPTRLQLAVIERKRRLRQRIRGRAKARSGGWSQFTPVLEGIVPLPKNTAQRAIELSTAALAEYAGSLRPNTWIEHIGTGVHVRIPSVAGVHGSSIIRPVMLQGSPVQMDKVEKKLRAIENTTSLDCSNLDHPVSSGLTLKSINSLYSFRHYVSHITARTRTHRQEKLIVANLNRYTAQRLVTAFADPRISRYASTVALNTALRYLNCHYELRGAANRIYAHGWRMGIVADISTMNLRLDFAMRHNMARLANSTVQDMSDLGVPANSHTWSLLYYMSPSRAERLKLVESMDRAKVRMTREARARLALLHIEEQLPRIRNDRARWKELVGEMDASFGRTEWWTASTLKRLLHQTKRQRLPVIFEELVDLVWEHDPSQVFEAHVECFYFFRSIRDLPRAVKLLRVMADRNEKHINIAMVIPAIYMTAWDLKATNVCRLLWMFAATRGMLTDTMQTTMVKSLYPDMAFEGTPHDLTEARAKTLRWRHVCARAVSGVDTDFFHAIREDYPQLIAQFPGTNSHIQMIAEWASDEGVKREQTALIKAMHHRDTQAWKTFSSASLRRLLPCLTEAQKLDFEWMKSGKVFDMSVEEARQDTMVLPINRKSQEQLQREEKRRGNVLSDAAYVHTDLRKPRPRSLRHLEPLSTQCGEGNGGLRAGETVD